MRGWLWLGVLAACSGDPIEVDETDTDATNPDDSDGDTDVEGDADTDADSDADSDADADADTDADPQNVVRFVALGDGGEGNPTQFAVGDAMKTVCDARGCDFAIYLGDNFYDSGVSSVDDGMFQTHFEQPYADLDFPFWVALGNHDYGGEGLGIEFWKADYQIEYTDRSTKWTMPDRFYTFTEAHVQLVALDTNAIMYDMADDQSEWIEPILAQPSPGWRIGFGHHPYVSNGPHGNAGNYEGIDDWVPFAEIPRGDHVKEFFDDHVCGRFDLYFSGHDHDRQWLQPPSGCATDFIVSGAAAKTSENEQRGNPVWFEDYDLGGFAWVEIADDTLTIAFYDEDARMQYEQTVTR